MYLRAQKAYPMATNAVTGGAVMGTGDISVQYFVEKAETIDLNRSAVCSGFNFVMSAPLARWYGVLDRLFPPSTSSVFAAKVVVNQLVSSPILSPGFLAWTSTIDSVVAGRGVATGLEQARTKVERDAVPLLTKSFCLWLPANTLMFTVRVLALNFSTAATRNRRLGSILLSRSFCPCTFASRSRAR